MTVSADHLHHLKDFGGFAFVHWPLSRTARPREVGNSHLKRSRHKRRLRQTTNAAVIELSRAAHSGAIRRLRCLGRLAVAVVLAVIRLRDFIGPEPDYVGFA